MKKIKLQIENIKIDVDKNQELLKDYIIKEYAVNILDLQILKKSLDARKKTKIVFHYRVMIEVDDSTAKKLITNKNISPYSERQYPPYKKSSIKKQAVIVGAGPAGIFCALHLIECGVKVIILERGKKVEERAPDIQNLKKEGILNPESNFLFGEGGAGTWSDGKLTTRINKPGIDWIYQQLIKFGAPHKILYEAKPHIGSDILFKIIQNIRQHILESGSQILFKEKVTGLIIKEHKIWGVRTINNNEYQGDAVIIAVGHSARDFYALLSENNILLEKKGFAVGARIEHPAEIINKIQYGKYAPFLEAADYRLAYNDKQSEHEVSFCMCPGGEVINSSSEEAALCTNGMSYSKRGAPFSNAALVASVWPADLPDDPRAGIIFQRQIEKSAFKLGGGQFFAPAQHADSFLKNRLDKTLSDSSYLPGITPAKLNNFLPEKISLLLKKGLYRFDQIMPGFIKYGLLIGAETRTSSPVRIVRGKDFQSVSIKNLYPIGEGAGYAGGIISSAVDGFRAASLIIEQHQQ